MPIRLRLAVWYGTLTALTLLVASLLSYAYHAHGHYDDLDRVLVQNVGHAVSEASHLGRGQFPLGGGDLEVVIRLYGPRAQPLGASNASTSLPSIWPPAVLGGPQRPAYSPLVAAFPGFRQAVSRPPDSAFLTLTHGGQRWRVLVQALKLNVGGVAFVEALTPLGRLDSSLAAFRSLLVALDLASVLVVVTVGWWLARGALQPITRLTATARAIASSRDLTRRVHEPAARDSGAALARDGGAALVGGGSAASARDEVGQLAQTFNAMLANLEEAFNIQKRFVADASHELRAPLTAISGNLELLRRQPGMSASERSEALAEAERETARMTRLVADLLVLARADAGVQLRLTPVDLDGIVVGALTSARRLPGGQRLKALALEPLRVLGDADRLTQLVVILVDNALKHTPAPGSVSVSLVREASGARLEVRDTGPGIAADDLERVFERFYRADPARGRDPGGTGLGLSIARWIAEQHHAEIRLVSGPGGTTATVRLPLLAPADSPAPAT